MSYDPVRGARGQVRNTGKVRGHECKADALDARQGICRVLVGKFRRHGSGSFPGFVSGFYPIFSRLCIF